MFTNNVIICNNSVIVFLIRIVYNNSIKRTTATNTADKGNIKNLGSNRRRSLLVLFFYVSKI